MRAFAASLVPVSGTEERFWSKVDIHSQDECWIWMRAADARGYGRFGIRPRYVVLSHRYAWALTYGDPGGLSVLHRCDNPPCCNPNHLFLGTHRDNSLDMAAKGRHPGPGLIGERHPKSKLRDQDVLEIRISTLPGVELAKRFGVTPTTICAIRRGRTRLLV
jgi:hypothetical protein